MRWISVLALGGLLVGTAGCGGDDASQTPMPVSDQPAPAAPGGADAGKGPGAGPWAKLDAAAYKTSTTGLTHAVIEPGNGPAVKEGQTAVMHYTGWLKDGGTKFDSSRDRAEPFPVTLGAGEVIKGWDQGIVGMTVGEKRQLVIPSDLAYGPDGRPGIPPNATLVFDVELVEIR